MARFKGKTIEEATKRGLQILGSTREDADVYVVNAGQTKFFGLYHVAAEVEIIIKEQLQKTVKINVASANDKVLAGKNGDDLAIRQERNRERLDKATEEVINYLVKILEALGIDGDLEVKWSQNTLNIQFETATEGLLIGKYGRTINAMQTLAIAYLTEAGINHPQVMLNVGSYREERNAKLERLAYRLADKVVSLQQYEILEPMPAFERKVIHSALVDDPDVLTTSIGKEPFRRVKIELAKVSDKEIQA